MKSMKIMLPALLLSLGLGAYAQEDDELFEGAGEDSVEVSVPLNPSDKPFFHRVQVGYVGTSAKYTNNSEQRRSTLPAEERYFLSGVSMGWMGDFRVAKRFPLYIELGASFTYHTGRSKDDTFYSYHSNQGGGEETTRHYRIQAFSLTIPISLSYQFRDVAHVKGLTVAPLAGVYGRFNLVANRWETATTTTFINGNNGAGIATTTEVSRVHKSLLEDNINGHDGWMEGRPHEGKLFQVGAQVGVNAFYKHYTFGLSYMCDIMPFAKHSSPTGVTIKTTDQGGNLPSSGTGCDMKISTMHNFSISFGYIF